MNRLRKGIVIVFLLLVGYFFLLPALVDSQMLQSSNLPIISDSDYPNACSQTFELLTGCWNLPAQTQKTTATVATTVTTALATVATTATATAQADTKAQDFIQNRMRIEVGNSATTVPMLVFSSPWVNQKQARRPILPNYVYLYLLNGDAVALVDLGYDGNNRAKVEVGKLTSQDLKITFDGRSVTLSGSLGYLYASLDWQYAGSVLSSVNSWSNPATSDVSFRSATGSLRLKEGLGFANNLNLAPMLVYATPNEEVWLYVRSFQPGISTQIRDTEAAVKLTHAGGHSIQIEVTKSAAASITVQIAGRNAYTFPLTKIANGVGLDIGYWATTSS